MVWVSLSVSPCLSVSLSLCFSNKHLTVHEYHRPLPTPAPAHKCSPASSLRHPISELAISSHKAMLPFSFQKLIR